MSEPLFSAPPPDPLASALHKLRWARDGEWSVPLSPGECGAVLAEMERVYEVGYRDGYGAPGEPDAEPVSFDLSDVVVSSSQTGVDAVQPTMERN